MNVMLCVTCRKEISEARLKTFPAAITCNARCSRLHSDGGKRICRSHKYPLATGTTGAIAELLVAVDLMNKGVEVFRALSPTTSCDLLVLSKGQAIRVEVRSATSAKGKLYFSSNHIRADVVAVVSPEDDIHYMPDIF